MATVDDICEHALRLLEGAEYAPFMISGGVAHEAVTIRLGGFEIAHVRPADPRGIEILKIAQARRLAELRRSGGKPEWRRVKCQPGNWSVGFFDLQPLHGEREK